MDKAILKTQLIAIKNNNYEVKSDQLDYLLSGMLEHIGSIDSELRDDLIYLVMANWIMNGTLTPNQIKIILATLLDEDHMFYQIGEKDTDSIFTRSFSMLQIPPILIYHRKVNFLTKEEINEVYNKVVHSFVAEKDLRDYTKDKGWADSVAHGADALDDLALCSEITYSQLTHILNIIKNKVCINHYVYINEENERLVTAIISVLSRKIISTKEFSEWVNSFATIKRIGQFPEDRYLLINVKNLLRSLYFRLLDQEDKEQIIEEIKKTLKYIGENY